MVPGKKKRKENKCEVEENKKTHVEIDVNISPSKQGFEEKSGALKLENIKLKKYEKLLKFEGNEGEKIFEDDGMGDLLESIINIEKIEAPSKESSKSSSKPKAKKALVKETKKEVVDAPPKTSVFEKTEQLSKRIKGIINRLALCNLEPTLRQLEEIFVSNSRKETSVIFKNIVIGAVTNNSSYSVQASCAALVSGIYTIIGPECVVGIVYDVCNRLLPLKEFKVSDTPDEDYRLDEVKKSMVELCTFISLLYNFDILSSPLMYDIMNYRETLDELGTECILIILRVSGNTLREENPKQFKNLLEYVNVRYSNCTEEQRNNPRLKFLLNCLTHFKNNKWDIFKNNACFQNGVDPSINLMKTLKEHLKSKGISQKSQLKFDLQELLSTYGGQTYTNNNDTPCKFQSSYENVEKLKHLAKKYRINTDVRRAIFTSLLASDNFASAFENILKLNLKDVQEREILKVVINCALYEKNFNPFYALVAQKFCNYKTSFKTTLKYILWDYFKKMDDNGCGEYDETISESATANLAMLYSFLYARGNLSFGILSPLQFTDLCAKQQIFLKYLFYSLFTSFFKSVKDATSFLLKAHHSATDNGIMLFFKLWKSQSYSIHSHSPPPSDILISIYDSVHYTLSSSSKNTIFT